MPETRWRWKNFPVPEAHLGFIVVGMILDRVRPSPKSANPKVVRSGWVLMGSGAALAAWATRAVGTVDLEEPSGVVTTGPYRFSRNPMYIGWTLIYVGCALVARSRWMLRLLPGLLRANHQEILGEERMLGSVLGPVYEAYTYHTPRYLAPFWRRRRVPSAG